MTDPRDEQTPFDDVELHLLRVGQELSAYASKVGDLTDPEQLAYLSVMLRTLNEEVRESGKHTRKLLASVMADRVLTVPGVGDFTRRRDEYVRWDFHNALQRIVARVADEWTGEPPAVFAEHLVAEVEAVAGFSYLRKNALRARSLDPDEFSEREDRGLEVQLPKKARDEDLVA